MKNIILLIAIFTTSFAAGQSNFHRSLLGLNYVAPVTQFDSVNAILIAGQSNAEGRADTIDLVGTYYETFLAPHPANQIYYSSDNDKEWQPEHVPFANKQGGTSPGDDFGLYASLSDTVYKATGSRVFTLMATEGNTGLAADALNEDWNVSTGELYQTMKNLIFNSRISAYGQNVNLRYKAVVWAQGEEDSTDSLKAIAYEANLTDLIDSFRIDTGLNVPWVIIRTQTVAGTWAYIVRAAQAAVASALTNVYIIDSDTYTLRDAVHYDADSQILCGHQVYALLKMNGFFP